MKTLKEYRRQYEDEIENGIVFELWLFFQWLADNEIEDVGAESTIKLFSSEPDDMQDALLAGFTCLRDYLKERNRKTDTAMYS